MLEHIISFAAQVHQGQKDMAGVDYMQHLFAVRDLVGDGVQVQAAALLHDVLEDGADIEVFRQFCTSLKEIDGDALFQSVCLLSKNAKLFDGNWVLGDSLSNNEYYQRMTDAAVNDIGKIAIQVKMADLKHNMDLTRLYGKKGYRSYTGDKEGFSQWVLENRASISRHYYEYQKRLKQLERIVHE